MEGVGDDGLSTTSGAIDTTPVVIPPFFDVQQIINSDEDEDDVSDNDSDSSSEGDELISSRVAVVSGVSVVGASGSTASVATAVPHVDVPNLFAASTLAGARSDSPTPSTADMTVAFVPHTRTSPRASPARSPPTRRLTGAAAVAAASTTVSTGIGSAFFCATCCSPLAFCTCAEPSPPTLYEPPRKLPSSIKVQQASSSATASSASPARASTRTSRVAPVEEETFFLPQTVTTSASKPSPPIHRATSLTQPGQGGPSTVSPLSRRRATSVDASPTQATLSQHIAFVTGDFDGTIHPINLASLTSSSMSPTITGSARSHAPRRSTDHTAEHAGLSALSAAMSASVAVSTKDLPAAPEVPSLSRSLLAKAAAAVAAGPPAALSPELQLPTARPVSTVSLGQASTANDTTSQVVSSPILAPSPKSAPSPRSARRVTIDAVETDHNILFVSPSRTSAMAVKAGNTSSAAASTSPNPGVGTNSQNPVAAAVQLLSDARLPNARDVRTWATAAAAEAASRFDTTGHEAVDEVQQLLNECRAENRILYSRLLEMEDLRNSALEHVLDVTTWAQANQLDEAHALVALKKRSDADLAILRRSCEQSRNKWQTSETDRERLRKQVEVLKNDKRKLGETARRAEEYERQRREAQARHTKSTQALKETKRQLETVTLERDLLRSELLLLALLLTAPAPTIPASHLATLLPALDASMQDSPAVSASVPQSSPVSPSGLTSPAAVSGTNDPIAAPAVLAPMTRTIEPDIVSTLTHVLAVLHGQVGSEREPQPVTESEVVASSMAHGVRGGGSNRRPNTFSSRLAEPRHAVGTTSRSRGSNALTNVNQTVRDNIIVPVRLAHTLAVRSMGVVLHAWQAAHTTWDAWCLRARDPNSAAARAGPPFLKWRLKLPPVPPPHAWAVGAGPTHMSPSAGGILRRSPSPSALTTRPNVASGRGTEPLSAVMWSDGSDPDFSSDSGGEELAQLLSRINALEQTLALSPPRPVPVLTSPFASPFTSLGSSPDAQTSTTPGGRMFTWDAPTSNPLHVTPTSDRFSSSSSGVPPPMVLSRLPPFTPPTTGPVGSVGPGSGSASGSGGRGSGRGPPNAMGSPTSPWIVGSSPTVGVTTTVAAGPLTLTQRMLLAAAQHQKGLAVTL